MKGKVIQMKSILLLITTFVSIVTLSASCVNNNKQDLLNASACDTSTVKYSTTIAPIMTNYCTNCHGGSSPSAGINLEGHTNVKTYVDNGRLWGSMNHDNGYSAMPQGTGKLDACTINKLLAWIHAGALNN